MSYFGRLSVAAVICLSWPLANESATAQQPAATLNKTRVGGLLYFAGYRQRDNPAAVQNRQIVGPLLTIYWSDVEPEEGRFVWETLDRQTAPWLAAGKKVALRIMWVSSGNWDEPAADRPTPGWVIDKGARMVVAEKTARKTYIPLVWDPIYRRCANRFLVEVARKFDGDENVLFIDVTPGAETNPYRFRRINVIEPEFRQRFTAAEASDGRRYSHELWLETVKQSVDDAVALFQKTQLLVTLNVGSLDGPEQFQQIGEHCVQRGCLVGQNGLNGRSYLEDSPRRSAFLNWGRRTGLYFEMVDPSGRASGTLMEVMRAAERIGCDYLGVYAVDVLRGTPGYPEYDPSYEAALQYGARVVGR
jgi:hypothetical protein